ncbi:MAG: hypothetical protein ACKVRN_01815 [Pyrinomonadaceae bacterium]
MKTAISVSDEIFTLSEKLAKKLKISRSSVFAMGVKKLNEDLDKKAMIERINKVCAEVDTSVDPVLKAYTSRKLQEVE